MVPSGLPFETLSMRDVRCCGRARPPAVTILLPACVAGTQARPSAARLKNAVGRITHELDLLGLSHHDIARFVAPVLSLTNEPAFREGRKSGLAILIDRAGFHCYETAADVPESVIVANHFHLKPLLRWIGEPRSFLILELAQGKVRLIEGDGEAMREKPLPKGVPESFEQISSSEPLDHARITRAGSSRVKDKGQPISFGLMTANEDRRMQFFCTMLDRGLSSYLQERGLPLILAGGDRILAAYRKENSYHDTVAGVLHGNIEYLSHEEIINRARTLISADVLRRAKTFLAQMQECAPGERWLVPLDEILRSAIDGCVRRLFLADGVTVEGSFREACGQSTTGLLPVSEDLVNAAAMHTIASGGEVYLLPADDFPLRHVGQVQSPPTEKKKRVKAQ